MATSVGIIPGDVADPNKTTPKKATNRGALTHTSDVILSLIQGALNDRGYHILEADDQKHHGDVPRLDSATNKAWKKVCKLAEQTRKEKSMYHPIAKFLTLLTNFQLLFVLWDCITVGSDSQSLRQDIIAVGATNTEIQKYHKGNQAHKNLPARYLFNGRARIYYADIQYIIEVKSCKSTDEKMNVHIRQLLKYLFLASRYQPRHAAHRGILAYRDGFVTVDYYPDAAFYSKLYPWSSNAALAVLWDTFKATRLFTIDEFVLIAPPEKVDENGELPRYQYCFSPSSGPVEEYLLHDIHHGHGWTRNAYVGFAIPTNMEIDNFKPSHCAVLKHGWHDIRHNADELEMMVMMNAPAGDPTKPKLCRAGLVRVDLERSRTGAIVKANRERKSVTLFLKTIGDTLAHCKSVLEFLKVMYDLVEVHRMLVEDHGILHRDISWSNVLINVIHLDDKGPDDLCDRPFIDVMSGVEKKKQKSHATLSDYDCASLINKIHEHCAATGGITGTPMFISSSLCEAPRVNSMNSIFFRAFRGVYGKELPEKIFQRSNGCCEEGRSNEVREFLVVASQLEEGTEFNSKRNLVLPAHAPIHDAESIFWIIIFFFLRACPERYNRNDPSERGRRNARTKIFDQIMSNKVGVNSTRAVPRENVLLPAFYRFVNMFECLETYFHQAWHCLPNEHAHRYQFHGHNALQFVLLNEIRALEREETDILLDKTLLGVDSDNKGVLPSNIFYTTKLGKRSGDDATGNNDGSRKRQSRGSPDLDEDIAQDQDMAPPVDNCTPAGRIRGILKGCKEYKRWFMGSVHNLQVKIRYYQA